MKYENFRISETSLSMMYLEFVGLKCEELGWVLTATRLMSVGQASSLHVGGLTVRVNYVSNEIP